MRCRPFLLALILSLVLIGLVVPSATPSWAATRVAEFTIGSTVYTVNGQPFVMDVAPYTKNARTYLPVRYVAYALGIPEGNISFYNNRVVSLTKGDRWVLMTIGSKTLGVNVGVSSVPISMDVPLVIKNGRTMLPLRWIAQAFGATVDWDPVYRKVTISLAETQPVSQTGASQVVRQTQVPQAPSGLYLALHFADHGTICLRANLVLMQIRGYANETSWLLAGRHRNRASNRL